MKNILIQNSRLLLGLGFFIGFTCSIYLLVTLVMSEVSDKRLTDVFVLDGELIQRKVQLEKYAFKGSVSEASKIILPYFELKTKITAFEEPQIIENDFLNTVVHKITVHGNYMDIITSIRHFEKENSSMWVQSISLTKDNGVRNSYLSKSERINNNEIQGEIEILHYTMP